MTQYAQMEEIDELVFTRADLGFCQNVQKTLVMGDKFVIFWWKVWIVELCFACVKCHLMHLKGNYFPNLESGAAESKWF